MMHNSGYGKAHLAEGVVLIVLGILTLVRPSIVYTSAVIIYGVLAICVGVIDVVTYVRQETYTGFGSTLSLIGGIFCVMTGCMLLRHQDAGQMVLLILFSIWFIAHCVSRLTQLHFIRVFYGNGHYWFTLIVNIAGIVLGFLMLFEPSIAFVTLGGLLGVYLILLGIDNIWLGNGRDMR